MDKKKGEFWQFVNFERDVDIVKKYGALCTKFIEYDNDMIQANKKRKINSKKCVRLYMQIM